MHHLDLTGSCLCGSVMYKVSGNCEMFNHCHCSRCRKATGTGHASNLLFKYDFAEWLSGEALIKTYKVPDAERFSVNFCSSCGSYLPKFIEKASFAVVPAGTVDSDLSMLPTARIFQNSRTQWSGTGDDIPTYDEFPQS